MHVVLTIDSGMSGLPWLFFFDFSVLHFALVRINDICILWVG